MLYQSNEKKNSNKPAKAPIGKISAGAPTDRLSKTLRGNNYILVVMDYFSKWVEILPISDQTLETCPDKVLTEVIARIGCPQGMLSDQGRNFERNLFQAFCRILEIKKTEKSKSQWFG